MKRRTFLSLMGAAALTSSMMLTGCGAGSGDDRKIVRIGHVQSQTHPDHLGLEAFANYMLHGKTLPVQCYKRGSCRTAITPASSCGACASTRAWMTMLSITAPTRSPTSWTPAVPPPACDTIGELLETQEHFSSTPHSVEQQTSQTRRSGLFAISK